MNLLNWCLTSIRVKGFWGSEKWLPFGCCCQVRAVTQPVPGALCSFKPHPHKEDRTGRSCWQSRFVWGLGRADVTEQDSALLHKKCLCIKATTFQNLIFTSHFIIGPAFPIPRHAKLLFLRCRWYNYLRVKLSFPSSPLFDFLIFTLFPFSLLSCVKLTCCKFWWR